VCEEIVNEKGHLICKTCIKKLPFVKEPYCIKCGKEIISEDSAYCDECNSDREFEAGRGLCNYTDEMRHIILKIKYDNKREYIEGFAKLMAIRYEKFIKVSNIDCIMPVPLHSSRKRMRGFNQSDILAKDLSKYLDIHVLHDCLCRVKKTIDQKGLSRTERLHNLDNAFIVKDLPPNIKNILIVDDVYTTGTTIEKCAKVLKDSGANKIYFLTICTGSIS
jgi:phosphoribosyltransferase